MWYRNSVSTGGPGSWRSQTPPLPVWICVAWRRASIPPAGPTDKQTKGQPGLPFCHWPLFYMEIMTKTRTLVLTESSHRRYVLYDTKEYQDSLERKGNVSRSTNYIEKNVLAKLWLKARDRAMTSHHGSVIYILRWWLSMKTICRFSF